ncbi:MAG: ABC transporter permease [Acidimicrobiia bacterium]|nr:ABC transporter permease [Acidimicrobiia bacterium]
MLRLALKGVLAHKVRLAMTALAIVLGVAFVAGTYVFTDSIKSSFSDLFDEVNSGVDLYVSGVSEFGFTNPLIDEGLLDQVRELPGVVVAAPSVEGIAQIVLPPPCEKGPDADFTRPCPIGGNGPPTLGFSYSGMAEDITPLRVRDGDWPRAADDVVIDAFVAENNNLLLGAIVDIITPVGVEPFRISGIATFGDADNLMGATVTVFEFETAQRIFEADGKINSIAIVLDPAVDATVVQAQIASFLPEDAEVITGQDQSENDLAEFGQGLGFINTILLVIAGVAVFVGAFLIQNTFRIIVAQRTRELALLRAVGATSRQVTVMVVIEALAVGVIASIVGIGAGILIAMGLRSAFSAFGFGIPSNAMVVAPRTIVVGMLVGIIVTLVAALVPARKAAKVPPVAALREVEAPVRSLARRLAIGVGVTGAGLLLLAVGLIAKFDNALAVVGAGAVITFVGVSLLAPLVARAFARWAGAPMSRLGITGTLARGNAMRQPRRTASTASALMIGVALVTVIAVFSASAKAAVASAFRDSFSTEFQVRLAGFNDPRVTGLPPSLAEELRALPELDVVVRDRFGDFRFDENSPEQFLLAIDGPYSRVVKMEMSAGSMDDLGPGTAVLSKVDADRLGLSVGDEVSVQFASLVTARLEVVGIFDDETVGVPLIIDFTTFEQYIDFHLDRFIYIKVAEGVDLEVARDAIAAVTDGYPNATLTDTEELIGDIEAQIDGLLNLLVVLLGFAIIIALMGIVNTLALSVAERKHEIGLLRAVGMSRRQVKRMIRWEAVLIAIFGGVLGLIVGVVLGSAVVLAVGQGLELALPVVQLAIYLVVAALGGVLAAILPARRGARLDILEAIAYE